MTRQDERAARVANAVLDTLTARTGTADQALRALAYATAHVCLTMGIDIDVAVRRLQTTALKLRAAQQPQQGRPSDQA